MMKTQYLLLIVTLIQGCAAEKPYVYLPLEFYGSAKAFSENIQNPRLEHAIEISALSDDTLYTDFHAMAHIDIVKNGATKTLSTNSRFAYVFEHNGVIYSFFKRDSDIYLEVSLNGDEENFTLVNGGLPVLTHTPGSDYATIWNVGVTFDDQETAHMLIECASNETDPNTVGLAYSSAKVDLNGVIDFDANRTPSQTIKHGGNPTLNFVPGKGIIALYGVTDSNGDWFIRAATSSMNSLEEFRADEKFIIGTPKIQVCDPHLVSTPSGLKLYMSYDQRAVYETASSMTMSELYDAISAE